MKTVFDVDAFSEITASLMGQSPDRARAVMVENNAYYLLVNLHIFMTNMAEFSGDHESALEPVIDAIAKEVERIQAVKGNRWLDDFIAAQRSPR